MADIPAEEILDQPDTPEETVRSIASDILASPVERLRDDHSMTDLKATGADCGVIFERSAEALNVDPWSIIETMPAYTQKASDGTMTSLRMLSAASGPAADLLDLYTVRPVDDTLGSIAAALRTGRFIDSSRRQPPVHGPAGLLALVPSPPFAVLFIFPVFTALIECWHCCSGPGRPLADYILNRAWRRDGPVIIGGFFTSLILGVQFLPGLRALRTDARLRRDRRDIRATAL